MNTAIRQALAATGYMPGGEPARGLLLEDEARSARRHGAVFAPDALWSSESALRVYFKAEPEPPANEDVSRWRQEIWNEGFAPLLWVVSPQRVDLYNGFGAPTRASDAEDHRLGTFENIESQLRELDALAGRLAMETGRFWAHESAAAVNRKTAVDRKLLSDLAKLERGLVASDLERGAAQALIGRIIFTQYLVDREIVGKSLLHGMCGRESLPNVLRSKHSTAKLFAWLTKTFNGDMFPESMKNISPAPDHLSQVANFLEAVDPESGQRSFFPYQFNVIPVELISSIYEQFAHASPERDVHYTRLSLVSLVLDEVMDGLTGDETVLDLTCGSGVFLVEAFRRLVDIKRRRGDKHDRNLIRETLYKQIDGIENSDAAIRVAAFSLYLAALELDPAPRPPHALRFKPLIGANLRAGDAFAIKPRRRRYDLIVGNPPWSFQGREGTVKRRESRGKGVAAQPRGQALDFLTRAMDFSNEATRFGIVLNAMSFFNRSKSAVQTMVKAIRALAPVTLVNLSNLKDWLFATAKEPAMVLCARHRPQARNDKVTIVHVPWSPDGERTHSFEISSNDISAAAIDDIAANPAELKAATMGYSRDRFLLDELTARYRPLDKEMERLDVQFRLGLIWGKKDRKASELRGLGLLQKEDLRHLHIPDALPAYQDHKAERPRSRETYQAPLLIVKRTLAEITRLQAAVSDRDIVFTIAHYGASFSSDDKRVAHLLAAIISSAFSSWFFYLTASEFGIRWPMLRKQDLGYLPVPELIPAVNSQTGKKLLRLEEGLRNRKADAPITPAQWSKLDEAVFDLYGLKEHDRIIVRDGLFRAESCWDAGRAASAAPADCRAHLREYAEAFLSVMRGWLSARKARVMRAEIIALPQTAALRMARFVLEDAPGNFDVNVVNAGDDLNDVLARIGKRLKVKVAMELSVQRELRLHGRDEVVIIKPAARRYWLGIKGLEDADKVVADSFTEGRA